MLFFLLVLSSVSGVAHFILSLLLVSFCPECLVIVANVQRITIFGVQTYSNIFIEGILLKMLRNKSELDLEQAI